MIPLWAYGALFLFCAALAWALTRVLVRVGPSDPPRDRGLHVAPTPTAGGVAVIAAVAVGMAGVAFGAPQSEDAWRVGALLAIAGGLGLFSLADDLWDFGAKAKLAVHVLAALAFAVFVARVEVLPLGLGAEAAIGPVAGVIGTALWLLVVMNAVNFMDGANGLAPGAQVVAFLALFLVAPVEQAAVFALAVAAFGAAAGFVGWNVTGKIFQGDAGALFASFLFGGLCVLIADAGTATPWYGGFVMLPLLVDVLWTLAARARRGAPLLQAHREHLYQLYLARTGMPHAAVSLIVWGLAFLSGLIGVLVQAFAPDASLGVLVALTVLLSYGWLRGRKALNALRTDG